MGRHIGWQTLQLGPSGLMTVGPCGHWMVYRLRMTAPRMHDVAQFNHGLGSAPASVNKPQAPPGPRDCRADQLNDEPRPTGGAPWCWWWDTLASRCEPATLGRTMDAMTTGTGPVVLIVDDSEDVRSLLAILPLRVGYRVMEALDGQAALELTADRAVDLVVLDLSMPRVNGAAFCRAYRERGGVAPLRR